MHVQTKAVTMMESFISKQRAIKKERQKTRSKTMKWQTMSKYEKIHVFQQTQDQSHLAKKSSKLDMDKQPKSLTDWYTHNNSIGLANMPAMAA